MSVKSVLRVAVVGAGVIGLSTVVHLAERFAGGLELTLISDKFPPNTTSDKSGAIITPLTITSQDETLIRWMRGTFQKFHSIYKSEDNAKVEITLQAGYLLLNERLSPDPWWKDEVIGFRHVELDSEEASSIHVSPDCVDIVSFITFIVESRSYMNWLLEKVKHAGVVIHQRKVTDLSKLSSYDVVINCTGLGSRELLDDQLLYPLRGQVVVVKAPWVRTWLMEQDRDGSLCYIYPRSRDVILGGTAQANDWSEVPDPETASNILKRCREHFPSLSGAEVIGGWVGLRPQRDHNIRFESCKGSTGNLLIHNYGHGKKGVAYSWGCAHDIGDIVKQQLL